MLTSGVAGSLASTRCGVRPAIRQVPPPRPQPVGAQAAAALHGRCQWRRRFTARGRRRRPAPRTTNLRYTRGRGEVMGVPANASQTKHTREPPIDVASSDSTSYTSSSPPAPRTKRDLTTACNSDVCSSARISRARTSHFTEACAAPRPGSVTATSPRWRRWRAGPTRWSKEEATAALTQSPGALLSGIGCGSCGIEGTVRLSGNFGL